MANQNKKNPEATDEHAADARDADPGEVVASKDAPSNDLIPDWAPWATLLGLMALGVIGGLGLLPVPKGWVSGPAAEETAAEATAATATTAEPTATAAREGRPVPKPAAKPAADQEMVEASHLLIKYKGAFRAGPEATRTKEEAKKRAEEAAAKAQKGVPFEKLVAEYSEGPTKSRGGKLGRFSRKQMVKPFADAAFALKPGETSGVVETRFGFHVIHRTK